MAGDARSTPRHRITWSLLAAAIVLVGAFASLLGAHSVASRDAQNSAEAQAAASTGIAATLRLALQHEQDLDISAGSFVTEDPQASAGAFRLWVSSESALQRFPELRAIAAITLVPASGLDAFLLRESSDPTGTVGPGGVIAVDPAGVRPYYCLATGATARSGTPVYPAGLDYCDTPLGPALLAARDSGRNTYIPFGSGGARTLAVGSAIYRGGAHPTTVAARRAGFLGWTGSQIAPRVLIDSALAGHPHTALTFRFGTGSGAVTFGGGSASPGAQTTTIDLHNGWHVATRSTVATDSILANPAARYLLLGGILISLLLGSLIYVLGTGRSRATALVHNRTEELTHLAFHDPLTGLPNRVLIIDRLAQMMLRFRRSAPRSGRSISTSTISRTSTTPWDTRQATSSWCSSPIGSPRSSGRVTPWAVSGGTSSWS